MRYSPAAGVHPDGVTLLDEERHLDHQPGRDGDRLGRTGDPVALHSRLGVGDLEFDRRRELDTYRPPVVHRQHRGHPLGEVVGHPADLSLRKWRTG